MKKVLLNFARSEVMYQGVGNEDMGTICWYMAEYTT